MFCVPLRKQIGEMLGIPEQGCPLCARQTGQNLFDGVRIEKWIYQSEPGSWVTALLYLPECGCRRVPAVILTNGHGESKSTLCNAYTGQLYAKAGIACLAIDTIGEEERHCGGQTGTRAHDQPWAQQIAEAAARSMMGKMVLDTLRGVELLAAHAQIDPGKMAVAGNSLGGAVAQWVFALEPRLKTAVICGFGPVYHPDGKPCTYQPGRMLGAICNPDEFLALYDGRPVLLIGGDADNILDPDDTGWFPRALDDMLQRLHACGNTASRLEIVPEGGHRAYHNGKTALLWLAGQIGAALDAPQIRALKEITLGQWCAAYGLTWEKQSARLYWTDRNQKGGLYADLCIRPAPQEMLTCLAPEQIGDARFTMQGWLNMLEKQNGRIDR